MKEDHFAILRRHMVEVIGIYVDLAADELGTSSLDERILAAMARVPRHAFRRRWLRTPIRTRRCRSASTRRSRRFSSWRS
jgi:hypothetical protein